MLSSWRADRASFSIHSKRKIYIRFRSKHYRATRNQSISFFFEELSERKSSKYLDHSARHHNDAQFNDRDLEKCNGCCLHLCFACHCRRETMAEILEHAESALFHSLLHVSPCTFLSVRARLARYLRDRSSGSYPFEAHDNARFHE